MGRCTLALVVLVVACGALSPPSAPRSSRQVARASKPAAQASATTARLDPAARLVDGNQLVRRALAFPVGFASASNWLASCIYVAAKLNVFDALAHGPRTVSEVAADVGADPATLGRLMRALGGQGPVPGLVIEVFEPALPFAPLFPLPFVPALPFGPKRSPPEDTARRYALTPLGAMLRSDAVGSMRPWAIFSGEELGRAWSNGLLSAVKNGRPDFAASQGVASEGSHGSEGSGSFFAYMQENADAGARFDASMEAVSSYALDAGGAADLFDWTLGGRASTIVDVGGGTGTLLAAILAGRPSLRGVLFDQAHTLLRAPPVLDRAGAGVRERVDLVAGSFFEAGSVPSGGDVYVLKNIVHDWDDGQAVRLLRNVGAAMGAGSVLVLLEVVRSDRLGHEPWLLDFSDLFDLNMLVTVGGKERNRAEWERLLHAAGFELTALSPGPNRGICAIAAKPRQPSPRLRRV